MNAKICRNMLELEKKNCINIAIATGIKDISCLWVGFSMSSIPNKKNTIPDAPTVGISFAVNSDAITAPIYTIKKILHLIHAGDVCEEA